MEDPMGSHLYVHIFQFDGCNFRYGSVESWDLRSMHLGLASLESIAMSIGAHVKELDLGGQENCGKHQKNHGTLRMTRAHCQPPPQITPH